MKKVGVMALVAIVAVAAALWLGRRHGGSSMGDDSSVADVAVPASEGIADPVARTEVPASVTGGRLAEVALPPADMPISEAYAALKAQADAGAPRAACRLAFELMRCRSLVEDGAHVRQWLASRESTAEGVGMPEGADALAMQQIEVVRREVDCRQLPAGAFDDATDYLYRAASAGVPEAQVRYVSGQMFGAVADRLLRVSDNGYLRHPEFDRWRRVAPGMAERLMATHPSAALYLMANAYGGDDYPFDALVPDDPVLQWAYVEAVRRRHGAPARPDTFDAAERARVAAVVSELGDRIATEDPLEQALLGATGGPGTSLGDEGEGSCD